MDRSSRQKNKETLALSDTLAQMALKDTEHSIQKQQHIHCPSARVTSPGQIMLSHKINLKFKRIEIISSIFSNHNDRKLEINGRKLEIFTN